ncbi:MAG: hypothetical protein LBT59_13095 [Clostridiales bacterium]|jgi:hypothetical protein|nr:hypothetical protein [Clostridiales bacterium]
MSVYGFSKEDIKAYAELESSWLIESEEGTDRVRKSTQSEANLIESVLFSALDAIRLGYDEATALEVAENVVTNYRGSLIDGFSNIWERAVLFLAIRDAEDYSKAGVDEDRKIDTNAAWDSDERGDIGKFFDELFSGIFKYIVG